MRTQVGWLAALAATCGIGPSAHASGRPHMTSADVEPVP
jgi:hypothetical protein